MGSEYDRIVRYQWEIVISDQRLLFSQLDSKAKVPIPQGFRYLPELIDKAEEHALATALSSLDLKPFEFHGHVGNRRVVSFGLSDAPPRFLDDLRIKIARICWIAGLNLQPKGS